VAGPQPQQAKWGARALVIVTGALIGVGLAPFAVGLLGAIVLYEVSARPFDWLVRRIPRRAAASLTVAVVLALVGLPAIWLTGQVIERLPAARAALANPHFPRFELPKSGFLSEIGARAADAASAVVAWLPGGVLSIGQSAAWALLNWSIALLGLYYLLASSSRDRDRFARLIPLSPRSVDTLRIRLREATQAIVVGTLLSAAVQGAAIGAGFRFAGISDALFWGVFASIATLIPVVGNALVWLPALVFMLVEQRYDGALAIGIFGGVLPPLIDRVIRSVVSRRMGQVHPMITLVGALAGMRVAGVAGLVLGPVALAMFFALLEIYSEEN